MMVKHNEDTIDEIINLLKNSNLSFQQIANQCNVSLTHVYNINVGKRRKRDNETYPIRNKLTKGTRGLKFSQEECKEIHTFILENPKITLKDIAIKFNCSPETIRDINKGKTKAYRLEGYSYPLRLT